MSAHYEETKEVLPVAEAAKIVEAKLIADVKRLLTSSPKLAKLISTPPPAQEQRAEAGRPAPTLQSALASSHPQGNGAADEAARYQRAVAAAEAAISAARAKVT
jgi:hypothetical protein